MHGYDGAAETEAKTRSKQTKDTNPKDALAQNEQRVPLALIPSPALVEVAKAFQDGARKYGPYNWREKGVRAMTYLSAAERHGRAYLDGEDLARDSQVHHLAHRIACDMILLDSIAMGNLNDDRPPAAPTADLLEAAKAGSASQVLKVGDRVAWAANRDLTGTVIWLSPDGRYAKVAGLDNWSGLPQAWPTEKFVRI